MVSTLTEGLKSPWGLVALPGGDLLVSSRDEGTVHRIDGESGKQTLLGSVPGVAPAGEGGLLGLAVSATFGADQLVYAYFTTTSDNRIVRMSYDEKRPAGQQLGAPDTILRGIPKGSIHNGGRIAFGPDKMLYAGTGETGDTGLAQDKESLAGKILRMTPTASRCTVIRRRTRWCIRTGTAMCRGSPGTRRSGCGPPSSGRTPGTS